MIEPSKQDRDAPSRNEISQENISRDKDESVTSDSAAVYKPAEEQDMDDLVHNKARKESKKEDLDPKNR